MAPPTGGVKGWKDLTKSAPLPKKYLLLFDKAEWCRSRHRVRTWSYGLFISARGGVCGSSFILHAVLCYALTISYILRCAGTKDTFPANLAAKLYGSRNKGSGTPVSDWSVMCDVHSIVWLDMLVGSPPENGNLDPVRTEMPRFRESVCWKPPKVGPKNMFGNH